MTIDSTQPGPQSSGPTRHVLLAIVIMYFVFAVLIVLEAGNHQTRGWIYVGVFFASAVIFTISLFIWNTELASRRTFGGGLGTETWDLIWLVVFAPILYILLFSAVREFDTPAGDLRLSGITWLSGLAIYVSGWTLFTWSGVSNPFFEKTVRIQTEVEHRVVDSGPYSIVRHPGYVGFIIIFLATPLLLPSRWICILSLIAVLLFVIRTALEDRTLRAGLPGYAEYATSVRFRLFPGIW